MDPINNQQVQELVQIGRILLTEVVFPHLEAFSENALYCGRGMPTMNKYKTVKEVCDLTGLTRKHLYYFHHAKVVQAVAYANYSVEGYDGYKLYDDAAVEKLQQIALYYQLGLKRDEIRDIMLDPNYDSNLVLDTLLAIEQAKKARIERHIAALEYLKLTGTKNRLLTPLRGMSLEELGETILTVQETSQSNNPTIALPKAQEEDFSKEFARLLNRLQQANSMELDKQLEEKIIGEIFALCSSHLGKEGVPFVLGYFASAIGYGSITQELRVKVSQSQGKRVIQYFVKHPELHKQLADILG